MACISLVLPVHLAFDRGPLYVRPISPYGGKAFPWVYLYRVFFSGWVLRILVISIVLIFGKSIWMSGRFRSFSCRNFNLLLGHFISSICFGIFSWTLGFGGVLLVVSILQRWIVCVSNSAIRFRNCV